MSRRRGRMRRRVFRGIASSHQLPQARPGPLCGPSPHTHRTTPPPQPAARDPSSGDRPPSSAAGPPLNCRRSPRTEPAGLRSSAACETPRAAAAAPSSRHGTARHATPRTTARGCLVPTTEEATSSSSYSYSYLHLQPGAARGKRAEQSSSRYDVVAALGSWSQQSAVAASGLAGFPGTRGGG